LQGVYGVFSMQDFRNGVEREVKQGKAIADIAKKVGVKHFVYSSVYILRLEVLTALLVLRILKSST
jgi:hypothetical protein